MAAFITKAEQLKRMEAALPLLKQAAELISAPADMAETRHIEACYGHLIDDAIVELELSIEEMNIACELESEADYYHAPRGIYVSIFGQRAA